jgi:hypothetical protein
MKWQFLQTIQSLREWNRPSRRLLTALVITFCLLPTTARAVGLGDILSLLKIITSTIQNAIGGPLSGIQAISADRNKFHQEVIWSIAGINRARAFVGSTIGRYQSVMWQIHTFRTNSATLTNPSQLESLMRGGQSANINRFQEKYARVYSPVPADTSAKSVQRNLMDVDDALALASLKTTVLSDQATDTMLTMADGMERQSADSAPGSAPIISAGAQLANLQGQACLAKMLAAELRLEAAKLAHENTLLKQSAASTRNLQKQMQQVLSHPQE